MCKMLSFKYIRVDNLNKSYVSCVYTFCSINKYPGDYMSITQYKLFVSYKLNLLLFCKT